MATTLVQTTVTFHVQAVVPPSPSLFLSLPLTALGESPRNSEVSLCPSLPVSVLTLRKEVLRMSAFSLPPHVSPLCLMCSSMPLAHWSPATSLCCSSSIQTSSLSSGYLPACPPAFRYLLRHHLGSETLTSTLYKVQQHSPHPAQTSGLLYIFFPPALIVCNMSSS